MILDRTKAGAVLLEYDIASIEGRQPSRGVVLDALELCVPEDQRIARIRALCELAVTDRLGRLTERAEGGASIGHQILAILDGGTE